MIKPGSALRLVVSSVVVVVFFLFGIISGSFQSLRKPVLKIHIVKKQASVPLFNSPEKVVLQELHEIMKC